MFLLLPEATEIVNGELVLKEAEDARWLSKDELDSVKWLPAGMELKTGYE